MLATPTLAKIGSWINTGPLGSVPDKFTVIIRAVAGSVMVSDTPYVERALVLTLNELVRLLTPIVWPAATQAFGMPRPMYSGSLKVNGALLPDAVRPSAAMECTSARA